MNNLDEYQDLMTIDEVAKYFRVSTATIYSLVKEDKLKSVKLGNRWRIKKEDVISYINNTRC